MLAEDLEHVLVASFLAVFGLTAIVGNSSILLAVYKNNNLRTAANFCLVNLAVANIFQGLIAIPFRVLALQRVIPCVVIIAIARFIQGASNIALSIVSLDRFTAITQPFYYHSVVNTRRTMLVIILSWIFSGSLSLLPVVGWGRKTRPNKNECTCNFPNAVNQAFFWLHESLLTILPLIVMIFSYVCIFTTSRRHILKIHEQRLSFRKNKTKTETEPQIKPHRTKSRRRVSFFGCIRKELRVVKVITMLAGIFLVLVVPSEIVNMIELGKRVCVSKLLRQTLLLLDYSNACVSAPVYAGFSAEYRDTFRRMWLHWRDMKDLSARRRPNSAESVLLRSRTSSLRSQNIAEKKERKEQSSLIKETSKERALKFVN